MFVRVLVKWNVRRFLGGGILSHFLIFYGESTWNRVKWRKKLEGETRRVASESDLTLGGLAGVMGWLVAEGESPTPR